MDSLRCVGCQRPLLLRPICIEWWALSAIRISYTDCFPHWFFTTPVAPTWQLQLRQPADFWVGQAHRWEHSASETSASETISGAGPPDLALVPSVTLREFFLYAWVSSRENGAQIILPETLKSQEILWACSVYVSASTAGTVLACFMHVQPGSSSPCPYQVPPASSLPPRGGETQSGICVCTTWKQGDI